MNTHHENQILIGLLFTAFLVGCSGSVEPALPPPDQIWTLCQHVNEDSQDRVATGSVLVVWADSGEEYETVQSLLPESVQPSSEDDLGMVACVSKVEREVGEYTSGARAFRVDYEINIVTYPEGFTISHDTVEGESPPYLYSDSDHGRGDPPYISRW